MNKALKMGSRRAAGFTLIELMIVVVIVAILAAIAYPSYQRYVQQTREAEAQGQIMELASTLEAYRAKNFSYNGATAALAPELDTNEHYAAVVNLGNSNQSYTIVATPQSSLMSGMGVLSYTSAGEASWE
ncbi:type IV pilin protein [Pseudomonas sp. FME51]|uniref:type IV pilin protein n=1 Tax=Pseudomonas sp. FME51 TaxID=2742609 RepID=UPI00299F8E37|nr:type IV pilin protein [Pseudomonas sp. FME51]